MEEKTSLLFIDDEPDILEAYKMMLEESGYSVYTAANKNQALEILEEYPIALCLIDLKMGEDNGLDISQALNQADSLIKIIIITAYPTYETAVDAIKMGIFDYVSKTMDPRELLEKIGKALEQRNQEITEKIGDAFQKKRNIILLCNHILVQGGIENFCRENPTYHLMHCYHSLSYIKSNDFNQQSELLLLCQECLNPMESEDPGKIFFQLRGWFPNARMVMINNNLGETEKILLIKWGVKGFLPENTSMENMKKAFDFVLKGELWISRELTNLLLNHLLDKSSIGEYKKPAHWYELSKREEEILQAMAAGLSNLEISVKFSISESTVKLHINHIFKKLNVKSRTQAVMKAQENRII